MEVVYTPIEGVLLIKPKLWSDRRGYFLEAWQKTRYKEIGVTQEFVQDNFSKSSKGTLRGLHYQKNHPQGKLVMISLGEVFDVVVDIRKTSKTFGKWFGVSLSEHNHYQVWIPPGLAHGFLVLSDTAYCHYKCTDFYHPEDEYTILWNDIDLNIKWPNGIKPLLSHKDSLAPTFIEYCSQIGIDELSSQRAK